MFWNRRPRPEPDLDGLATRLRALPSMPVDPTLLARARARVLASIPQPPARSRLVPRMALAGTIAALEMVLKDLLVHDMGVGLADGVSQGEAGPREFRTAPLWGLGQRIFFLHDGRTADLLRAIREHASPGSEANGVIWNFSNLGEGRKQDILNFLRSL